MTKCEDCKIAEEEILALKVEILKLQPIVYAYKQLQRLFHDMIGERPE